CQRSESHHPRQQVVKVMRDRSREEPDRFHTLRLDQALFRPRFILERTLQLMGSLSHLLAQVFVGGCQPIASLAELGNELSVAHLQSEGLAEGRAQAMPQAQR